MKKLLLCLLFTFEKLNITPEDLLSYRMEGEMNILNFAIDNERVEIIRYLAKLSKRFYEFGQELVNYRFGKDQTQAIH